MQVVDFNMNFIWKYVYGRFKCNVQLNIWVFCDLVKMIYEIDNYIVQNVFFCFGIVCFSERL